MFDRHINKIFCAIILLLLLLTGCTAGPETGPPPTELAEQVPEEMNDDRSEEENVFYDPLSEAKVAETIDEIPDSGNNVDKAGANPRKLTSEPVYEPVDSSRSSGESTQADKTDSTVEVASPDASALTEDETVDQQTVLMTINGIEGSPAVLQVQVTTVEPGDTVLDLLIRVTREKRIHMAYRGRGKTGYVEGINNLYEFDQGPASGWVYSVNGVFPDRSAGGWEVAPGDEIVWWYSLDAGRDVGAMAQ